MERKMIEKISEAYCKWEEHINLRFAYAARDEYMPMNLFPDLFKETFELMREMNNEYIYLGKTFKDPIVMMSYIDFIALISKYVVYDSVEDNSFFKYFTVTSIITEKLIQYATRIGRYYHPDNTTVVYLDDEEEHEGRFEFDSDDYPPFDSDNRTKHTYNIYDGNFEDLRVLAAKLN